MSLRKFLIFSFIIIFADITSAQLNADFAAADRDGCPPFTLKLFDNSTGSQTITSWEWTINGNFLSNQKNPATLLNSPGFYSICLTVSSNSGLSNTECKNNYIQIFELPTAQFESDISEGCVPLPVTFTDTSIPGSSNLVETIWDLGGSCGVISTNSNESINCNYTDAGSFQISMIVTDQNGCQASLAVSDYIQANGPPAINSTIPNFDDCQPPLLVDFGNAGPNDPSVEYNWDFGNGQTFTGINPPEITYTGSGPYSVLISATNLSTGCFNSVLLENAIAESNPLNFSFEKMDDCGVPEVIFNDESIGSADLIEWDFGDGNSSFLANPVHNYGSFGCYTVVLTRTTGNCTKSFSQEVCVLELSAPLINTSFTNPVGCLLPHTSDFNVNANPDFTYNWNFGDGATSSLPSPSHSYNSHGIFDVTLSVLDPLGCEITIDVGTIELNPLSISLGTAGFQGCSPLNVNFDPQIISVSNVTSYDWNILDDNGNSIFQSNLPSPSFSFVDLGCYDVSVTIQNAEGCQFSETFQDVYCVGQQPNATFSMNPMMGCASQVFSFTDNSTGSVDFWQWDFQSNGTIESNDPNPTYTYEQEGCFNVTLTVSSLGCASSTSLGPVCIEPPISKFNFTVDCDSQTLVNFSNNSIGADSLIWDFGDTLSITDTSTALNPSFIYDSLGTFVTTLITYNFSTGCTDTVRHEVILDPALASFEIPSLEICKPASFRPVNNSTNAVSYRWTLPDGGTVSNRNAASPRIRFNESGVFSIELRITDENGCFNTFSIDNIQVSGPEPGFIFDVDGNCVPFNVFFTDTSQNLLWQNNSWEWNIEELELSSIEQNPSFEVDTSGIFAVELVVEDDRGCRDSIIRSIGLNEGTPVAYFIGDLFGCEGIPNEFEDLSVGNSISYLWDFGDGQSSSDQHPMHQFSIGDYDVCLTIDDANCIDTHCELVQIQNVEASFDVDEDYSSCAPSPVSFINSSLNAQDFIWDYGDGSGLVQIDQASHIYNSTGIFDVNLIAIGFNENCRDTVTVFEAVKMTGPEASFSYEIDDYCVPSELKIEIQGERAYNYTLFLGDGNSFEIDQATNVDTTYIFSLASSEGYLPTVLVVESVGCEIPIIGTDTILLSSLDIDFTADQQLLCDDDRTVFFESNIVSSDVNYSVEWEFENGVPGSSDMDDEVVEFTEPGIYYVNLIVSNDNCRDSLLQESLIEVFELPEINIPSFEICLGDTIEIISESNTDYLNWSPEEYFDDPGLANQTIIAEENLTLSVSGAIGPCPEISATSSIEIIFPPEIEMENNLIYYPGQEIQFGPELVDSLNYFWDPSDLLSCTFCANPIYLGDSIANFQLTVSDPATGCISQDFVQLRKYSRCPDFTFVMPNVFSPNGDGNNDEFKIIDSILDGIESLKIFDRWGNFIWETNDMEDGWDGKLNGEPMQPGVYVYVVQAICTIDGSNYIRHGDITLMR